MSLKRQLMGEQEKINHDVAVLREALGIRPTDSSSPERRRRREAHEALDRLAFRIGASEDGGGAQ